MLLTLTPVGDFLGEGDLLLDLVKDFLGEGDLDFLTGEGVFDLLTGELAFLATVLLLEIALGGESDLLLLLDLLADFLFGEVLFLLIDLVLIVLPDTMLNTIVNNTDRSLQNFRSPRY
jgi:hypothetical protein